MNTSTEIHDMIQTFQLDATESPELTSSRILDILDKINCRMDGIEAQLNRSANAMNLHIPDNWLEIDCEQFWKLLDEIDWMREAYANGERFTVKGCDKSYADGIVRTETDVAIHTRNNRYYINPTFFKPL